MGHRPVINHGEHLSAKPTCPECSSAHLRLRVTLRNGWAAHHTCKLCGHTWEATWAKDEGFFSQTIGTY
jgi:transposase-like protein